MTHALPHKVFVEAAIFAERKPVLMAHYAFTHRLTRNDFDQARDSFDYKKDLDPNFEEMFLNACRTG